MFWKMKLFIITKPWIRYDGIIIKYVLFCQGPDDVLKMGIAAYNKECRSIVTRYAKEWKVIWT